MDNKKIHYQVNSPLHFLYFCSSVAKRSTNNRHVCKYIGRIIDQSPDMTLDYKSWTRREYFLYRSISPPTTFCAWCQDDYRRSPRAMQWQRSHTAENI